MPCLSAIATNAIAPRWVAIRRPRHVTSVASMPHQALRASAKLGGFPATDAARPTAVPSDVYTKKQTARRHSPHRKDAAGKKTSQDWASLSGLSNSASVVLGPTSSILRSLCNLWFSRMFLALGMVVRSQLQNSAAQALGFRSAPCTIWQASHGSRLRIYRVVRLPSCGPRHQAHLMWHVEIGGQGRWRHDSLTNCQTARR